VVPDGFDTYCRIFHPMENGDDAFTTRWSDLAATNGRIIHSQMQFHKICRPVGVRPSTAYMMDQGPLWGACPLQVRKILVEILESQSIDNELCWFCVWEGFGVIDAVAVQERVRLPGRNYVLYSGQISTAIAKIDGSRRHISPNIWWPESRKWIVLTEVDYCWTYVAGSKELIQMIVTNPSLEALVCNLSDSPFYDGDQLNEELDASFRVIDPHRTP
jgi:hypothetical protein